MNYNIFFLIIISSHTNESIPKIHDSILFCGEFVVIYGNIWHFMWLCFAICKPGTLGTGLWLYVHTKIPITLPLFRVISGFEAMEAMCSGAAVAEHGRCFISFCFSDAIYLNYPA